MLMNNNTGLPSTFAAIRTPDKKRRSKFNAPLAPLSILEPGSRLNGKTLPNCQLPKPSGVSGLAAEGLGWDNAGDNMSRVGSW